MKWADKCKELMFLALCDDQCATEFTQSPANWEVRAVQSLIVELWAGFFVQSWRLVAEGALSYFDSSSHFIVGLRNQLQVTVSKASKYLPFLVKICPRFNNWHRSIKIPVIGLLQTLETTITEERHWHVVLVYEVRNKVQNQSCAHHSLVCVELRQTMTTFLLYDNLMTSQKCQQFQNNFDWSWAP